MIKYSDGSSFNGLLKEGQLWKKGNREKTIVKFDKYNMYYKTGKDKKEGTVTCVKRSSFRSWLYSGAVLQIEN